MMRLPRILIAAQASGGGKTTVATGLMAALRASGRTVAPFKVGPDYIDPGYHSMASGRPGRNLDSVMCGDELMAPLLAHGFITPDPADVAVIEGVMGLFDGQLGTGRGSSAEIATTTETPVVVVVDTAHASLTHAAVVAGLATFDPDVTLAGVILNRVSSPRHGAEVTRGLARLGIPVLGQIPRTESIFVPSRHLGLVPAGEWQDSAAKVAGLGDLIAEYVDLNAVMDLAAAAPDLDVEPWDPAAALESAGWQGRSFDEPPLVGIFAGRAFTFRYPETTEMLTAAGFQVVDVDPLTDRRLPDGIQGLYLGGGFPQMHVTDLETNSELADDVRSHADAGMPIVAECAGLLYLCRHLDGHEMAGVLPMDAAMAKWLTMGYRVATRDSISVVGHEFHRTMATPLADVEPAWNITMPDGTGRAEGALGDPAGRGRPTIQASYLHLHWAGQPAQAAWFASEVARFHEERGGQDAYLDLNHHGDRDIADGLVDLAVNVRVTEPPQWLRDAITSTERDWARYPDATPGREALAAMHGVPTDMVLPTAGAAEAFPLVSALEPCHAVVVHPQFTEPEAALRVAEINVARHILKASDGFALDPALVPDNADLVIVGNPTNPTGRLHPATDLLALRRPGRILVIDEAFMDATDESQSLIGCDMDGLLVLRSLTKTYGLAGIRAGYVIGDRRLIARLADHQTPWSVSTPAIAAMIACTCEEARRFQTKLCDDIPAARADLVERLTVLGLSVVTSEAPFVLVDTSSLSGKSIRQPLAKRGFAVRRGETFPGLGPTWIRLAVRDPEIHAELARAISDLTAQHN